MAKELPYFKFYCSEWTDGDITLEPFEIQGLYINICSWYWSRECNITLNQLKKKFSSSDEIIDYLININLLKNKSGKLCISFLDEQMKDRKKLLKRNRENGLKGGRPKTQSVNSGLAKNNPKLTNIEKKRKEEKRREEVLSYLNQKTNKNFRSAKGLLTRFQDGYTVEDCKKVIDIKCIEWLNTDMAKYLRPETLFSQKFDQYLNQEPERSYKDLPRQGDYYIDKERGIVYNLDGSISKEWEWDSKIKQVVML